MTKGQRKAAERRIMRKRQNNGYAKEVGGNVKSIGKRCRAENWYYN